MRILFAGGGTAGHINPAIAMANELKRINPLNEIKFVGTDYGLEDTIVPKAGYELYHIDARSFKRALTLENIRIFMRAVKSLKQADEIINDFQPNVVIGTGGYVSGPVLKTAAKRKIPTIIHEQNAYPGITSKLLSKKVDTILISFEDTKKHFKTDKEIICIGNPVRREIIDMPDKKSARRALGLREDLPVILSFGGSQGAQALNDIMSNILIEYGKKKEIQFIHGYGKLGRDTMPVKLKNNGIDINSGNYENIKVSEYIYNMPECLAAADIAICRAGAMTITDLAYARVPALLIPYPYAANNHQYYNGKAVEDMGGGYVIEENSLTYEEIYRKALDIVNNKEKLGIMGENISKCVNKNANDEFLKIILQKGEKHEKENKKQ